MDGSAVSRVFIKLFVSRWPPSFLCMLDAQMTKQNSDFCYSHYCGGKHQISSGISLKERVFFIEKKDIVV